MNNSMTRCRTVNDYSAMQGPAPDGFHVPLSSEWADVITIWTTLGGGGSDGTNFGANLKLPFAGNRYYESGVSRQGSYGYYWSSSRLNTNTAYYLVFSSTALNPQDASYCAGGFSVRCFKNSPTAPTSSWTKLYGTSIESGGIFWSSTDGLISMSSDGQTWITIADKNLGATTVWNSGDTLSENNCGGYFQRGNNYMFPFTGNITTTSSTQVDASNYGPGNYYSSSTFITYAGSWDSTDNANLRGGETGIVERQVCERFTLHGAIQTFHWKRPYEWKPNANTIAYYPLTADTNDAYGNNNMTNSGIVFGTYNGVQCAYLNNNAYASKSGSLFTGNPTFTVSVWMNNIDTDNGEIPWSFGSNGAQTQQFLLWLNGSTRTLNVGGYQNDRDTGYVINRNTWYNVIFAYSPSGGDVYVNGVKVYSGTWSPAIGNSSTRISGDQGGGQLWYGYLSELIFENKKRTEQEVADYYNRSKSNYGL